MWRQRLLILCLLTISYTKQAETGDSVERFNCSKTVEVTEAKTLKLDSKVYSLQRCYFVFNEECCYGDKKKRDCEDFKKSELCLKEDDYDVEIDNSVEFICALVIKNVNKTLAGSYKSFSNGGDLLQQCSVSVGVKEEEGLSAISLLAIVLAAGVFGLVAVLVLGFFLGRRTINTKPLSQDEDDFVIDEEICSNGKHLHKLLIDGENDEVLMKKKELDQTLLEHTCNIGELAQVNIHGTF